MTVKVFISYARDDIKWYKKLEVHLANLKNQQLIHAFHNGDISPGKQMEDEILGHLKSAQIILLLISANYMATEFCYEIELKEAIARHKAKQAYVIPILLSNTYYKNAPFADLEPLPSNHKPIKDWKAGINKLCTYAEKGKAQQKSRRDGNTSEEDPR